MMTKKRSKGKKTLKSKGKKGEAVVLFSDDPEWYGYGYDRDAGKFYRDYAGEMLDWDVTSADEMDWAFESMLETLGEPRNGLLAPTTWGYRAFDSFKEAIYTCGGRGGVSEVYVRDGDLYANGILVRELTDKGQDYYDRNIDAGALYGYDIGAYCLTVKGYTRKALGQGWKPWQRHGCRETSATATACPRGWSGHTPSRRGRGRPARRPPASRSPASTARSG